MPSLWRSPCDWRIVRVTVLIRIRELDAFLVKDAEIIGAGWHERAGGAHAEIMALEKAGVKALGATAYVTLEPCCHHGKTPPCTEALIDAGVSKVIAAMYDPNPKVGRKGLEVLTRAGIEINCGLLEPDAEKLNRGFCKRMRTGKTIRIREACDEHGRSNRDGFGGKSMDYR